ncbi:hypothetical protein MMC28_004069 [Mycoblastus sanguinarius]|nr:hypothetical protein [Mycoblastus sanguinarius]
MEDSFYTNEDPEAESESESESEESDGEINAPLSEEPPELLDSNPNFRAETSRRAWRAKRRAEKGPKPHYRRHRPVFPGKRSGEGPEADALTQAHGPFEPDSTRSRTRVEMNSANEQGDDNPDIIILKHKGSTYTLKFPPFSIAQGSSLIGHLRQRAAKEFGVEDASRVTLVYKGKTLKTDNCTCHEEGLRMKSEVLCVIKRTPLEELDFLSNKFRSELLPQGLGFISNTPVDSQRRDFEYKKISETVMTQILFKLDALDINGDESARYIRKEIVKEATGFLERLDRAMKHADFFPQKEESKSIDARHSLPNRTSLTFSSSLRRSTTRDDDDPEFSPDQG